jgi:hypothetical protein
MVPNETSALALGNYMHCFKQFPITKILRQKVSPRFIFVFIGALDVFVFIISAA